MSPPVQVKHPVRNRLYPEFHRRDSVRLQDIADLTVDIIRTRRQPYSGDSVTDILFGSLKQRYHAFTFDPREAAAEKRDFRTVSVMKRHKRCLNRFGKFPAFLSRLLRTAADARDFRLRAEYTTETAALVRDEKRNVLMPCLHLRNIREPSAPRIAPPRAYCVPFPCRVHCCSGAPPL